MTAPVLTLSLDSLLIGTLLSDCPTTFSEALIDSQFHSSFLNEAATKRTGTIPEKVQLSSLLGRLFELLPQGIVVVSRDLKAIYWNQPAQGMCQEMLGVELSASNLPLPISDACHRLLREAIAETTFLMMEYQSQTQGTLRITARCLHAVGTTGSDRPAATNGQLRKSSATTGSGQSSQPLMVVLLENCDQTTRTEMQIQQKKYDLTDREAEIWMLLRQEYSYQEIAQILQISLNTVKTHVKNVYAKRRSCQGQDKYWWVSH